MVSSARVRTWSCLPMLLLLASAPGCSDDTLVPVAGRVTLDGAPVEGAAIGFSPLSGMASEPAGVASYARTDADGRFELRTIDDDRKGAVPGPCRVTITTSEDTDQLDDAGVLLGETIPEPWSTEGGDYEVPADGTDTANFDLATDS